LPRHVRVVCGCGNRLGDMKRTDDGWANVDPRSQPDPPRMTLGDFDKWYGHCGKCRATPQVKRRRLEAALDAVSAAGLRSMPFRGL
jgi:hypothetical protein